MKGFKMNIKERISDLKDIIILSYNYFTKPYVTTYFDVKKPSLRCEIDNMLRRKKAMMLLRPYKLPNKYWLEEAYNDNFVFNDLAGNTNKLSLKDIDNQTKLIEEETKELREAVNSNDPVEVLDAVVDLYVVLDGLTSKLVALGFDVSTALKQTIENNLSKFPTTENTVKATVDAYAADDIQTTVSFNESHQRFAIKDQNGKIRKPVGFVSNDLSNCVPENFVKF